MESDDLVARVKPPRRRRVRQRRGCFKGMRGAEDPARELVPPRSQVPPRRASGMHGAVLGRQFGKGPVDHLTRYDPAFCGFKFVTRRFDQPADSAATEI